MGGKGAEAAEKERHGAGRAEGAGTIAMEREGRAEGAERAERRACTGTQSREAMGAMGRDGTMEPWGHEPLRVRGMGP